MPIDKNNNQTAECMICGIQADYFLTKDNYDFRRCSKCGLVFLASIPDEVDLKKNIYSKQSGYQSNKIIDLEREKLSDNQKKIVEYIIMSGRGKKVLDIGCSSGRLIYYLKKKGCDVYGIELNPVTAEIALNNKLNVFNGSLNESNLPAGSFDFVIMGDLIEHLPKPVKVINKIKEIIKKDGQLIIATPNLDCFWAGATLKASRWFSLPWSVLTPPYHIFQFSEKNLVMFMKNNGFSLEKKWYHQPTTLRYELGSTHLWGNFRRGKTAGSFLKLFYSFLLYAIIFFVSKLVKLFSRKQFGLNCVFKKI